MASPVEPSGTQAQRPRVVVLGGGFAGVGAARALKDADADVVLVDEHNYHTFQPLLYQLATDLLETSEVGHPLRDLFHEHPNVAVHQDSVTGVDLAARRVHFAEMAPLEYDYLVLGLGARVNFFGTEGAAEHAFPMYTLADALRLKEHVLRRWEAADKDPALAADGALNVVVVGGGPTGVESAGAMAELYTQRFRRRLSEHAAGTGAGHPGRGRACAPGDVQEGHSDLHEEGAREAGGRHRPGRDRRVRLADARDAQVRDRPERAHARLGRGPPGQRDRRRSRPRASRRGNRVVAGPDLSIDGHPEVFAVGDIAWITDTKTKRALPQLGSVALQAGERAGANIVRRLAGKETEPFVYHDKGTMATIGRGAAVVQFHKGRTLKGKAASLAWGTVHLALLSTGEDRAKAMVEWTWAGFTHERPGRITVRTDT